MNWRFLRSLFFFTFCWKKKHYIRVREENVIVRKAYLFSVVYICGSRYIVDNKY